MKSRFRLVIATLSACCLLGGLAAAADPATATAGPSASWGLIDQNLADLEGLIKAGKIGSLGKSAYGIANAFQTLAAQSGALSAEQLAQVQKDVPVVGSEVSKLDKAGEHNDPAGVQSHLQTLKSTLDGVRGFYKR